MLDPIPSKLVKEVLPEVIDPLLAIIYSSLSLGYVPKIFKLAVIKPLIEKSQLDPKDLVNYRPISNLPFLSKILEKVVSSQLNSFLEKNFSQNLEHLIVLRLLSLEWQITCSHHPIMVCLPLKSTMWINYVLAMLTDAMMRLVSVSDTIPIESYLTCGDCGPKQKSRKPLPVTFSSLMTVH